jgi:glutamine synthetase
MAGLDGVKNKINPGDAIDFDLYEASESQLKNLSTVSTSLEDALDSLEKDHDFLIQDGVFTKDQISGYIDLKREEVSKLNNTTHPIEFDMYYSV